MRIALKRSVNFTLPLAILLAFLAVTPLLLLSSKSNQFPHNSWSGYNADSSVKTLMATTAATEEQTNSFPTDNASMVVIAGENRSVQIEIMPDTLETQTGAPNSPLIWLVIFKNTGNTVENFALAVSEALSGVSHSSAPRSSWGASLDNTNFILNPETKAVTYLRVTVPGDAKTAERDNITVTISNGVSATDNYMVSALVLEPGPRLSEGVIEIAISAQILAVQVWPNIYDFGVMDENKTATTGPNYFTVRNTGNVNEKIVVRGMNARSMPGEPVTKWILDPSSTGVNHYMLELDNTILTNADQPIWENVTPGSENQFGVTIHTPAAVSTPATMWLRIKLVALIQVPWENQNSTTSNVENISENTNATVGDNIVIYEPYNHITTPIISATVGISYGENVEGTTVTISVTITNNSNIGDTFSLSASDTMGWSLNLSAPTIYLDSGSSGTVNLMVNLPPDTGGQTDIITVTATSSLSGTKSTGSNQVRSLCIIVNGEVTILSVNNIAHCSVVKNLVNPSYRYDPLTFAVKVQNDGILDDMYELCAVTDNTGLGLKLSPDELYIPSGDTGYAALSVTIPTEWWGGWSGTITVIAKSKKIVGRFGNIEIRKVDEFCNLLSGATFKVTPNPYGGLFLLVADGGENDSDQTPGVILLKKVPLGTYTITEEVAPAGYQPDNAAKMINITSCDTITMTFTNRNGEMEILKVDEAGAIITNPGSTFVVSPNPYGAGDLTVVDDDANDRDPALGIILLENLPLGTYTVTEIVAPLGYELDPNPKQTVISSSARITITFVNSGGTTTTTQLSASTIILGQNVTDTATVTGLVSPLPTGIVDFQVKLENGAWTSFDNRSLTGGTATSVKYTPFLVGQYWFRAVYGGDNNYNGSQSPDGNEPLTVNENENEPLYVNKAPSTTTTALSTNIIIPGDSITDTVTVTGLPHPPYPLPTGTVIFQVKFDEGGWVTYDNESLVDGTATSIEYTPLLAGQYWFRALYSGDNNYKDSQSPDDNEPLMVTKHDTTTRTQLSASVIKLGENVTDTAIVTGLPHPPNPLPTGTITFQVKFNGGPWVTYDTENLVDGIATSVEYTPLAAGQYWFRAVYSGDNFYNGSQSP